jgi:hypothetical protein
MQASSGSTVHSQCCTGSSGASALDGAKLLNSEGSLTLIKSVYEEPKVTDARPNKLGTGAISSPFGLLTAAHSGRPLTVMDRDIKC